MLIWGCLGLAEHVCGVGMAVAATGRFMAGEQLKRGALTVDVVTRLAWGSGVCARKHRNGDVLLRLYSSNDNRFLDFEYQV
ncbi:hypothetical protein M011DRAFT_466995 [Sporormia fimetaria CBS 119925]|uniref:Uncharacterized protein n=1 Tax=Sporormia fimetaria CBS 119925 TaxID=1340428 RepID=A0A6A6VDY6_9PLEO|nr:hypothetical protein M011DRAFT_466995 [Sporormia fimetaria CBS 119925]